MQVPLAFFHQSNVFGLHGKIFVAGSYGGGFCKKMLEALPMADRAKASWLQDRPATGQGWAHQQWWLSLWDNRFKKGKKKTSATAIVARERSQTMWEQQLCRHPGQWKSRGGGAPGTRADSPAACGEDHREAGCPSAVHGGPWWSRNPSAPRGRDPMLEQVDVPKGRCDPMGSLRCSRLLAGLVDPWRERSPRQSRFAGRACDPTGDPCWSTLLLKDCTPWKGPMLGQFVKNCSPWEGLMLENFMEDCLLWQGLHAGAGEECEECSSGRGRSGRSNMWCTDHSPTPCPPVPLGGK